MRVRCTSASWTAKAKSWSTPTSRTTTSSFSSSWWRTKKVACREYALLQTVPGIGQTLGLIILHEIGDIHRFPSVKDFLSYCRLVKGTVPAPARSRVCAEPSWATPACVGLLAKRPSSPNGTTPSSVRPVRRPPGGRISFLSEPERWDTISARFAYREETLRILPASRYQGSGIGLTILRRAGDRTGGTLGFESVPAKQSKSRIVLRKGRPGTQKMYDDPNDPTGGRRGE